MKWHSESRITTDRSKEMRTRAVAPTQAPCARLSAFLVPTGDFIPETAKTAQKGRFEGCRQSVIYGKAFRQFMAESLLVLPARFTQNFGLPNAKSACRLKRGIKPAARFPQIPAVRGFSREPKLTSKMSGWHQLRCWLADCQKIIGKTRDFQPISPDIKIGVKTVKPGIFLIFAI